LPVAIDNDGNAAAIAEWQMGRPRGARDLVMLTLGTGVGGGLIFDGKPYRGATGSGAELGHVVVELDGPRAAAAGAGTSSPSRRASPPDELGARTLRPRLRRARSGAASRSR
jgi:predicted NBD/HSP70 family sugar kinase